MISYSIVRLISDGLQRRKNRKRKGRDSNPRTLTSHWISRPAPSTARTPFLICSARKQAQVLLYEARRYLSSGEFRVRKIFQDAGNRTRTCTVSHQILSLARLPIPPCPPEMLRFPSRHCDFTFFIPRCQARASREAAFRLCPADKKVLKETAFCSKMTLLFM